MIDVERLRLQIVDWFYSVRWAVRRLWLRATLPPCVVCAVNQSGTRQVQRVILQEGAYNFCKHCRTLYRLDGSIVFSHGPHPS